MLWPRVAFIPYTDQFIELNKSKTIQQVQTTVGPLSGMASEAHSGTSRALCCDLGICYLSPSGYVLLGYPGFAIHSHGMIVQATVLSMLMGQGYPCIGLHHSIGGMTYIPSHSV